jgi:hypothetical protein
LFLIKLHLENSGPSPKMVRLDQILF